MSKVAFITGCNSMLGVSIARKLLKNGYEIVAHYHKNKDRLDKLFAKFPDKNNYLISGELSQTGALKILSEVNSLSKKINVLVNNAATVTCESSINKLNWEILSKTFEVNLFAPVIFATNLFEQMKKDGGKIINISSIAAKYGGGEKTMHYGMSKAALDAMTVNLARQGAPYNILVNSIRPGLIDTDFHKRQTPTKDMKKRVGLTPLKRMASPDEIAAMVDFLISPNGDYITGEIITIAGGD